MVHDVTYTYDAGGNIIGSTGTAGPATYDYDALNRLTLADLPGTADDRSYQYDGVGNRDIETIGAQTRHYLYGAGNRLEEIRQGSQVGPLLRSFDYDDNGAVTAKRDGTGAPILGFTRNDRGQVMAMAGPGFSNAHVYDPRDLRIRRDDSQGSHLFHLQRDNLESVYDAAGALRAKYLRGSVIDEVVNGFVREGGELVNVTFHHDQLNSVVGLTAHNGAVEETRRYGPLRRDSLGDRHALKRARLHRPGAGSRLRPLLLPRPLVRPGDRKVPVGRSDGVRRGGDINLYVYAANNPLRFNDPLGLQSQHEAQILRLQAQLRLGVSDPQRNVILAEIEKLRSGGPLAGPDLGPTIEEERQGLVTFLGGSALATGAVVAAPVAEGFVLANPVVSTEIAGGVASRVLGGPDFFEPTLSFAEFAASLITDRALEAAEAISEAASGLGDLFFGGAPDFAGSGAPVPTSPGAAGGFVLYPSRPNLSSVDRAYAK